ncbi:uncharacterized protein [Haliotis cracherodii]|uniref:uncharacterized protein n=1 Tax=Haliotis cracherodii TaxID=6455 RepID=UPI0039E9FB3E
MAAARNRIVTKSKKFDHITPILRNLHWLKIKERIQYKVMLIVFNARQNQKPTYISQLLEEYVPGRSLRSSCQSLLSVPSVRTATFGGRSFAKVAPELWKRLPLDIRNIDSPTLFRSRLKTYLFTKSFLEY